MATDHFIGIPGRRLIKGEADVSGITVGTSSTAADFFEFRWQSDTGSGATGVIAKDALIALEAIRNFIIRRGAIGDGTGVPPTTL